MRAALMEYGELLRREGGKHPDAGGLADVRDESVMTPGTACRAG